MFTGFIIFAIFTLGMLTAAYKDALTMTIPNWVSLLILGGFFVVAPFVLNDWPTFGIHLLSGLSLFLFGFFLFAMGWLGGGDAKLMAATAFWWQWADLLNYLIYTTLAGGVLAFFILWARKFVPKHILSAPWLHTLIKEETRMPYGLALAFGALTTLPQSEIFKAAVNLA